MVQPDVLMMLLYNIIGFCLVPPVFDSVRARRYDVGFNRGDTVTEDIRWQQRFSNYQRALASLASAVELSTTRALSDLEQQGLIQAFEFTHELAWNCLKDYLHYQGVQPLMGSRDATRQAFSVGLITEGEQWMDMIANRNRTSHTYNKATADAIVSAVLNRYYPLFVQLEQRLGQLRDADA